MDIKKINAFKGAIGLLQSIGSNDAKMDLAKLVGDSGDATFIAVALLWDGTGCRRAMDAMVFNYRMSTISKDTSEFADAGRAAAFILINGGVSRGLTDDDLPLGVNHAPAAAFGEQCDALLSLTERRFAALDASVRKNWAKAAMSVGYAYIAMEESSAAESELAVAA